jgi:hypothetical protein
MDVRMCIKNVLKSTRGTTSHFVMRRLIQLKDSADGNQEVGPRSRHTDTV